MDIAAGNRHDTGLDPFPAESDGTGIGAPGGSTTKLKGDLSPLTGLDQALQNTPIDNQCPIHEAERGPLSKYGSALLLLGIWSVCGGGRLHRKGELRAKGIRGHPCPPQANLLLNSEGSVKGERVLLPEQLQQHGTAGPVVKSLAAKAALAEGETFRVEGGIAAYRNMFFRFLYVFSPDIDIELIFFKGLLPLIRFL